VFSSSIRRGFRKKFNEAQKIAQETIFHRGLIRYIVNFLQLIYTINFLHCCFWWWAKLVEDKTLLIISPRSLNDLERPLKLSTKCKSLLHGPCIYVIERWVDRPVAFYVMSNKRAAVFHRIKKSSVLNQVKHMLQVIDLRICRIILGFIIT